jgi:hypothetical protein
MRRLLRSKAGVSILCAGAVIAVAANFVHLPRRRGPARLAARESSRLMSAGDRGDETWAAPASTKVARALGSWRGLFPLSELRRDPFTLGLPAGVARVSTPAGTNPFPAFVVQAISIEGEQVLAVLNHSVVGVGDRIGEYEVEQISPGEVQLRSRWGRVVVPVRPGGSPKPSSVKVQPADLPRGPAAVPPGEARP